MEKFMPVPIERFKSVTRRFIVKKSWPLKQFETRTVWVVDQSSLGTTKAPVFRFNRLNRSIYGNINVFFGKLKDSLVWGQPRPLSFDSIRLIAVFMEILTFSLENKLKDAIVKESSSDKNATRFYNPFSKFLHSPK